MRRLKSHYSFRLNLLRSVVDWTVVVYFILPFGAFLVYYALPYWSGAYLARVTPRTMFLDARVHYEELIGNTFPFIIAVLHISSVVRLAIPFSSGDQTTLLLAPVKRGTIVLAMILESVITSSHIPIFFWFATYPLVQPLGCPSFVWLAALFCALVYTSLIRVLIPLLCLPNPSGNGFRIWLRCQLIRVASAVPLYTWVYSIVNRNMSLISIGIYGVTVVIIALLLRHLVSAAWYIHTKGRNGALVYQITGTAPNVKLRFWMVIPSRFLLQMLERVGLRFSPVGWLWTLRFLRRGTALRDVVMLTAAASTDLVLPSSPVVKVVGFVFLMVLANELWGMQAKDFVRVPMAEQTIVSELQLYRQEARFRVKCLTLLTLLWAVAAWIKSSVLG